MTTLALGLLGIALGCLLLTIFFALKERKARLEWHKELEEWSKDCSARLDELIREVRGKQ